MSDPTIRKEGDFYIDVGNKIAELEAQLAAERDDRISWQELYEKTNDQLAAEREVGGNTAIALAQQITKLEDQLAAAVEALKEIASNHCKYCDCQENSKSIADDALEKVSKSIKK